MKFTDRFLPQYTELAYTSLFCCFPQEDHWHPWTLQRRGRAGGAELRLLHPRCPDHFQWSAKVCSQHLFSSPLINFWSNEVQAKNCWNPLMTEREEHIFLSEHHGNIIYWQKPNKDGRQHEFWKYLWVLNWQDCVSCLCFRDRQWKYILCRMTDFDCEFENL